MQRGNRTMQGAGPNTKTGHHSTHHSRHSTRPPRKHEGDTNTQTGKPVTTEGVAIDTPTPSIAMPPTTTLPALPRWPPHHHHEGGADKGYPTTRTTHTDTHHPHTTHPATNSTRHDSSTDEYCGGMSRARAAPLHWGRTAAAHTTAIPHTEEDGHHPLITSHCSRSHNQRTIMINMIIEQQSMIND